MATAYILGRTADDTKETIILTKSMAKELIPTQMEASTVESGLMDFNMELEVS